VLLEKRIDGLVVASVGQDSDLLQSLAGVRTPMVIVDRELEGVDADLVRIDHELGAYLATRHLLELGHRDIAYIGGPAETGVSQLRLGGFRRAMAEAGATAAGDRVLHCDFTSLGGYAAAAQVLQGQRPTAIFAGNDMIGFGVLRAAAERQLNVPAELSVIGFDDIELSRYVYPPLTTVGQSIRELGESAASLLLARIGSPRQGAPEQRIVTPRLVLRESTGPRPDLFNDYR
jgi:LacI family transcriptional regulator